jgi:hypothetical protein
MNKMEKLIKMAIETRKERERGRYWEKEGDIYD